MTEDEPKFAKEVEPGIAWVQQTEQPEFYFVIEDEGKFFITTSVLEYDPGQVSTNEQSEAINNVVALFDIGSPVTRAVKVDPLASTAKATSQQASHLRLQATGQPRDLIVPRRQSDAARDDIV